MSEGNGKPQETVEVATIDGRRVRVQLGLTRSMVEYAKIEEFLGESAAQVRRKHEWDWLLAAFAVLGEWDPGPAPKTLGQARALFDVAAIEAYFRELARLAGEAAAELPPERSGSALPSPTPSPTSTGSPEPSEASAGAGC